MINNIEIQHLFGLIYLKPFIFYPNPNPNPNPILMFARILLIAQVLPKVDYRPSV